MIPIVGQQQPSEIEMKASEANETSGRTLGDLYQPRLSELVTSAYKQREAEILKLKKSIVSDI